MSSSLYISCASVAVFIIALCYLFLVYPKHWGCGGKWYKKHDDEHMYTHGYTWYYRCRKCGCESHSLHENWDEF